MTTRGRVGIQKAIWKTLWPEPAGSIRYCGYPLKRVKRRINKLKPITPGEILLEEFLKPMGLSQYRLAKEIGVPPQRLSDIVAGKRAITADTDLRLSRFFGLTNGYWRRAQAAPDTEVAERELGSVLEKIRPWGTVVARQDASVDRDTRR